jgi:hypothetical protein
LFWLVDKNRINLWPIKLRRINNIAKCNSFTITLIIIHLSLLKVLLPSASSYKNCNWYWVLELIGLYSLQADYSAGIGLIKLVLVVWIISQFHCHILHFEFYIKLNQPSSSHLGRTNKLPTSHYKIRYDYGQIDAKNRKHKRSWISFLTQLPMEFYIRVFYLLYFSSTLSFDYTDFCVIHHTNPTRWIQNSIETSFHNDCTKSCNHKIFPFSLADKASS